LRVAFVLKGYPRLSEAFIAQEIAALERRGLDIVIVSLRRPTDGKLHPVHREIGAPVNYLPEYLLREPLRVLRAWRAVRKLPTYAKARATWLRDLARDKTANRMRRFGQALVLAAEPPEDIDRARAFPAYARLGRALRGDTARPAVERVGARQGHLDDPRVGKAREAGRLPVGGYLHAREPCAPRCARARRASRARLSRRRPAALSTVSHAARAEGR
jgi:hypothetical protein